MSNIKTCQIFTFLNEKELEELIFQMVPQGPEVARILEAQYSNTDESLHPWTREVFDFVQQIVSEFDRYLTSLDVLREKFMLVLSGEREWSRVDVV